MKVLVIGANGQVGCELKGSLSPIGNVIALDRRSCDLTRLRELPGILREFKPDVIVNAAAYTAVDKAEEQEDLATLVNATAVGVIAEQARKLSALLIQYSTDYVFDGAKVSPYTEDDPPNPINAYGRSKLAGERAIAQSGSDYLILRTCWVFAASGHNFLRTILRVARERDELSIVADQIGAPTWARHLAEATLGILQCACGERSKTDFKSEILHVTAGGAISWAGFAESILSEAIARHALSNRPKIHLIASADYPAAAARPKNSVLSGERLCKRFAIALPEWRHGLSLCMNEQAFWEVDPMPHRESTLTARQMFSPTHKGSAERRRSTRIGREAR